MPRMGRTAEELGIKDIVVASTYSDTAFKVLEAFKGMNVNIVIATPSAAFREEGWVMNPEVRRKLEEMSAKVLTCTRAR